MMGMIISNNILCPDQIKRNRIKRTEKIKVIYKGDKSSSSKLKQKQHVSCACMHAPALVDRPVIAL